MWRHRGPWLALAVVIVWTVLIRVPLVLNAGTHLDSDLAVDGLTLRAAVHGHWRWHYPATPHIGIGPVLLSWPQAMAWGANPVTLVSAGTVTACALVVATFVLARRAFGPAVAAWSLVPLAFASTGTLWLSGRVTGGHMLAAAWHAGAFALLHGCLARGGSRTAAALGVWCGLGYYLDSMFLVTLAGLVPAGLAGWWVLGRSREGMVEALVFGLGFVAGAWPHWVGARVDPHDAYSEQFRPVVARELVIGHARILALDCLPRLIAGHRLPGLQADPDPRALATSAPLYAKPDVTLATIATTVVALGFALASAVALLAPGLPGEDAPARAVRGGLIVSAAAIVGGFITNLHIYNSDNYRYLVDLLVPGAVGGGLALAWIGNRGRGGRIAALGIAAVFAVLMTADVTRWYARFGWIDARGVPVRKMIDDPALAWLDAHPEVNQVFGGYWDVYRLAFLTAGRVRGVPYPVEPNRFPEWSRSASEVLIARPTPEGRHFRAEALRAGGRVVFEGRGFSVLAGH